MKDVVLNKNQKNNEKVFTKKKVSNTIRKNYNPLKVNYKIYERGSGLLSMKSEVLKEIRKELDWKGKIASYIFPKTFIKVYKLGITFGFNNK